MLAVTLLYAGWRRYSREQELVELANAGSRRARGDDGPDPRRTE